MKLSVFVLIALIVLALPWMAGAEELSDCATIESAVERLDCYDRLAKQKPADQPEPVTSPTPAEPAAPGSTPPTAPATNEAQKPRPDPSLFGKKVPDPDDDIGAISARLEKVDKTPRGNYVFTLSNGQIWMQNEPGRRKIDAGQDIVIRKHRFHYEMEFENIPDVPVRRVD